jgi:hypothetical protein
MIWLIFINFIATLCSLGIIWRGFCETDSSDLMLGVILLIVNISCFIFNLTREFYE